jgi:energy-coupling factor transporter transmembrane protein EcfT
MKQQNYENHSKIDPAYHVGIALLSLITLILTITFFVKNVGTETLLSFVVLFVVLTLILIGVKLRTYALQLQDRIIRTEESFRYYRLTGKSLDASLSLKQMIALRFSPDEEFPGLVERAVTEKLSPNDIKKAIQNWRADHHRV